MMKLRKTGCLFLPKLLLAGLMLWLWSANVSAYDFVVRCDGVDTKGSCGPGASFVMEKISNAHDATATPFALNWMQIYLANCSSDTSCTKLVGPIFEKAAGSGIWSWGPFATAFQNMPWSNKLTGTIVSSINAGTLEPTWNGNIYKGLCFSIMGGSATGATGGKWALWGSSSSFPAGAVQCDAPINRSAIDTCSVSTPSIDVAFGEIERSDIGWVEGATKHDVTKSLTINCTGTTAHNFSVKLSMNPVAWSDSQIFTSNSALGVAITENGTILKANDSFTVEVPGGGSSLPTNLVFSLLRNPSVPATSITTGLFTASATFIVTEL
ncbi:fimbrial protein [Pantoea sp. C2G6]|uniref:fimbrial protein n=1 Tax=Pantoea sp. C2G6 TaxID=3243084 RepID=UPI003EDA9EB8